MVSPCALDTVWEDDHCTDNQCKLQAKGQCLRNLRYVHYELLSRPASAMTTFRPSPVQNLFLTTLCRPGDDKIPHARQTNLKNFTVEYY